MFIQDHIDFSLSTPDIFVSQSRIFFFLKENQNPSKVLKIQRSHIWFDFLTFCNWIKSAHNPGLQIYIDTATLRMLLEKSFLLCWPRWAFKGIAKRHTGWGWVVRCVDSCTNFHIATHPLPSTPPLPLPTMSPPTLHIFTIWNIPFCAKEPEKYFPRPIFKFLTSKIVRLNGSRFIWRATSKVGKAVSQQHHKNQNDEVCINIINDQHQYASDMNLKNIIILGAPSCF